MKTIEQVRVPDRPRTAFPALSSKEDVSIKWLKEDNNPVIQGEPLVEVTFGSSLFSYLSHPEPITIKANRAGVLKILIPSTKYNVASAAFASPTVGFLPAKVTIGTVIGEIKERTALREGNSALAEFKNLEVDGLGKYLESQKDQITHQNGSFEENNNIINIFYLYDSQDETWLRKLEKHLSNLRLQNIIATEHTGNIPAGTEWQQAVESSLDTAHLFLLLVSPDFIASDFYYRYMQRLMRRHISGEAWVVPILLRPVDWKGSPFAALPMLPSTGQPITLWPDRDDAFVNVVKEVRNTIQRILEERLRLIQEQQQESNIQMKDLSSDYHHLETSLRSFPEEKEHLIKQYKDIDEEIQTLQIKMQKIKQKLDDISQKRYSDENKIKDIQQKATEILRKETKSEQEAQRLRAQIDKLK